MIFLKYAARGERGQRMQAALRSAPRRAGHAWRAQPSGRPGGDRRPIQLI
eukprot:SAG31_NODE_3343_length_4381_cov_12.838393_1_plen_50_part_00